MKRFMSLIIILILLVFIAGIFPSIITNASTGNHAEIDIKVYYPLYNDVGTVYLNRKVCFHPENNIEKFFEDIFKSPPSDKLIHPVSFNTDINNIFLDETNMVLRVDFSQEFLSHMNAGSSMEWEIIRSIVNTLGEFFKTQKVYISIEGSPYESEHYALREGEYFLADLTDIEEFK